LKKLYILLIVLLPWAGSSWGQPVTPLAPLQGGENIATAFVLSGPLPINSGGTTAGYIDDYDEVCIYISTAPDVVYAYTPPSNVTVDIDLCGSSYDTKVFVYENTYTPGSPFACDDDTYFGPPCGLYVSKIEAAALTGGNTYYIVIDGYDEFSFGDYLLTISVNVPPPPCVWGTDISCPPGSIAESESCGADANGGCNMAPETWEPVPATGGTICGTTWALGGIRDTDWFELMLTDASSVILTANADQEIFYGLVETTTPGAPTCASTTGFVTPVNTAGPCNETFLDLGVLAAGTYWFFAGMTVDDGFPCTNHYWINFAVTLVPCPPPDALTAGNLTSTTADLGWTEIGTATAWEYQYGPAGFVPAASGTPTTLNPTTIAGLSANTSYDFYVRADCGGGVYSSWSGPETFKTPCNPVTTIPWTENFDAMAIIGNNILPDCWVAISSTGDAWSSGNAASNGFNGPCSAPNFVFVDYVPYPEDKFLITPGFTLTAATSYDFKFNWIGDTYEGWTGDVLVNTAQTGTGATVLGSSFVVAGTITDTICTPAKRSFMPAVNGTYYFMVRVSNNVIPYYLGFDDFDLQLTPACVEPTDLAASSITQTSANLGWTPGGSETAWEFVYGLAPLPAPVGPGTATSSSTVNPISSLSENTEYQYYVRADCGPEFSIWAGPFSFSTLCDNVTVFPWSEGFETAWPPDCWTDVETAAYGWDQNIFAVPPHSGSDLAYCNLASSLLITPGFALSADSRLVFWYRVESDIYPQDMAVKIGNNVIYQITGAINEIYKEVHVSLAAYTGQTVSISFDGETGTGGVDYGICLDDVSVSLINTWTGNVSTLWNISGNWSLGNVPDQYDDVFIPSAPSDGNFPVIASGISAECYDITVAPGANIRVVNGGSLNVVNP